MRAYLWFFFFFNDTATTEIYTLSLHDALPISSDLRLHPADRSCGRGGHPLRHRRRVLRRSEEHTSELQSQSNLVCRLLLEKKKYTYRLHLYGKPPQYNRPSEAPPSSTHT